MICDTVYTCIYQDSTLDRNSLALHLIQIQLGSPNYSDTSGVQNPKYSLHFFYLEVSLVSWEKGLAFVTGRA
jgi:hypothetical protein